MAGIRSLVPLEYVKLSSRVALACSEHPQVFLTCCYLEMLAWGRESRTVEFDGDWFFEQFGIPQPTLMRHLNTLSRIPIQAILVYRSAGSGSRRITVTLAEMEAVSPSRIKNDTGIKNDTVSNMIIPVVVVKELKDLELKTTTSGIKNDTVSKMIPEPPNIFRLHEENFGPLTPLLADKLKDAEKDYPPEWVKAAFEIAVGNNKRFWSYVDGILKRWNAAGEMTRQEKTDGSCRKPVKNVTNEPVYSADDIAAAEAVVAMQAARGCL